MCDCQGNPLARVTLALGLPYLLVNRALITTAQHPDSILTQFVWYEFPLFVEVISLNLFSYTVPLKSKLPPSCETQFSSRETRLSSLEARLKRQDSSRESFKVAQ